MHEPPAEPPDDEYPLQLITGRNIYHYNTGGMTRNCPHLLSQDSENYAEINPKDAGKLGIKDGNKVKVSSIRGSIELRARVSERVKQGIIFMPFHFSDSVTNALTNDALDPIAKTPEYKVCAVNIERI